MKLDMPTIILAIIGAIAVATAAFGVTPVAKVAVVPPKSATAHISCSPMNQLILTVTPAPK